MFKSILSGSLPKTLSAIVLGAVFALGMAPALYAAPLDQDTAAPALFSPLTPRPAAADATPSAVQDKQVMRSRLVNIDLNLLTAAADASSAGPISKTISLNLFDNVIFVAESDKIERTERGVTWTGHLRDVALSQVVLVINGDVVAGNISMPMARYHIRYAGGGAHEVQRIDQSRFPRDEVSTPIPESNLLAGQSQQDTAPGVQADDGSIIDVMVVYSAAARAAAGSTAAIKTLIDLAVTETNQSYQNSGITQRVRLVNTTEVAYTETGNLQDALNCITSTTDGCLDNIHALRNTYGADLVSFWVEQGGSSCGLAWLMSTVTASFASNAFSVVARDCATGYYSFGHELGHNMGARHDVYVDAKTTPYSYAHGYVNIAGGWRSVMAYNNACADVRKDCTRIPYWSNPSLSYKGVPMGNASADNRTTLNNTASIVANFRASVGSDSASVVEFYNTDLDHYFITADAAEASSIDNGSAGPGWIRTGGSFKSGGSTSVCRFYGSQSPGPNSHFYTVDASECAGLRQLQAVTPDTQKRWNFESLDFISTPPANQTCPAGMTPVYRAYNNGYARNADSNHRITSNASQIQEVINRGWIDEGVVMCAPA